MRISDWSSDVCSSDLDAGSLTLAFAIVGRALFEEGGERLAMVLGRRQDHLLPVLDRHCGLKAGRVDVEVQRLFREAEAIRSEEHTSELQSLMRNSYAVFCLKKKKHNHTKTKLDL